MDKHTTHSDPAGSMPEAPATPRRRGRLLAGLVAAGVGVGALAFVAGAPLAGARRCVDTTPGWRYRNVQVIRHDFQGAQPVYSVTNRSSRPVTRTVTNTVTKSLSATISIEAEAEMKAAIFGGVKAKTGLSATGQITVSTSDAITVTAPARGTVYAQAGARRVTTTGDLVRLDRCGHVVRSHSIRATTPYTKDWTVWN